LLNNRMQLHASAVVTRRNCKCSRHSEGGRDGKASNGTPMAGKSVDHEVRLR
jgi:hypothetical protein